MERTLTAAAPPPPRDPYRHALTMRPPQKARPFSFLNYCRLRGAAAGVGPVFTQTRSALRRHRAVADLSLWKRF